MGLIPALRVSANCVGTADTEVCCKPTTGGTRGSHGDHAFNWMTEPMHSSHKKVSARKGLKGKRLPHNHSPRAAVVCAKSKTDSPCGQMSCIMKRDDRDAFPFIVLRVLPQVKGHPLPREAINLHPPLVMSTLPKRYECSVRCSQCLHSSITG